MNANRFQLLAGLLPPDVDLEGLDADDIDALAALDAPVMDPEDDLVIQQAAQHAGDDDHLIPQAAQQAGVLDHLIPQAALHAGVLDHLIPQAVLHAGVLDHLIPQAAQHAGVLDHVILQADQHADVEDNVIQQADLALVDDHPKNPWMLAVPRTQRGRRIRRPRRNPRAFPVVDIEPAASVRDLQYEWFPSPSSDRSKVRKWAQARRGGITRTQEGLSYFTYGCYATEV